MWKVLAGRLVASRLAGVCLATGALAALTTILVPLRESASIVDVAMLYLLVTLVAAAIWGYEVGLPVAVAADLVVNFFFIPPIHRFTVRDPDNVVSLVLFLAVAAVGASMLALLRRQAAIARARQAESAMLLDLSRELAAAGSPLEAMTRLCVATARAVGARGCSILEGCDEWSVAASTGEPAFGRDERAVAAEALRRGEVIRIGKVGARARTAEARESAFVPFRAETGECGVLVIHGQPHSTEPTQRLLRAFADQAALTLQRARLDEEARRADRLRVQDEFKSALLSSVSHDLRSPLAAIKASVGNLRDGSVKWTSADVESFLETIDAQADRLNATVAALLEMSRIEGGGVQPRKEPVFVPALVEEVVEATRDTCRGRPVDVEVEGTPWLQADYTLLSSALLNLVENAARYSNPGGRIGLTARSLGARVAITVSDEGPGIPPNDLPHIFEKFYRGSTARSSAGSGLGLALVDAAIRLCGGTVRAASTAAGAAFTVELPASAAPRGAT